MYCPQCGSSNVVEYKNKKNKNRLKGGLNQKQKKASTQKAQAVCQDCGYSWEFDDSQLNRGPYYTDYQRNNHQDENNNPIDNILGKIDETQEKIENFSKEHSEDNYDYDDDYDISGTIFFYGGIIICIAILVFFFYMVFGVFANREDSSDKGEDINIEQEDFGDETRINPENSGAILFDLAKMIFRESLDFSEEIGRYYFIINTEAISIVT